MSLFETDIAETVVGNHFERFGRVGVRYLDDNVDPVELTAIVRDEQAEETPDAEGLSVRHVRTVTISLDPDSDYGGVADPGEHATLEIDGVTWAIEAVESKGANLAELRCVRKPLTERSRQGYRGAQ